MKHIHTPLLIFLTTLVGFIPCLASEPDTRQTIALTGAQQIPVVVDDAAIQKAVESLIRQQQQNQSIDVRKKIPNKVDCPAGQHLLRNSDRVLILGGPEVIPM